MKDLVLYNEEYKNIRIEIETVEVETENFGPNLVARKWMYYLELIVTEHPQNAIWKLHQHFLNCYYDRILMEDILPFGDDAILVAFRGYIERVDIFNQYKEYDILKVRVKVKDGDIKDLSQFFNQERIEEPIQKF